MNAEMIQAEGRMIRKSISNSKNFANLSPEAGVLFCMIIPHLNAHGKLNGGAGFLKDEVCPNVRYLTVEKIPSLMREISKKTNMKWFKVGGRMWIHALSFNSKHQRLKRLGNDQLPDYSRRSPGLVLNKSRTTLGLLPENSGRVPEKSLLK